MRVKNNHTTHLGFGTMRLLPGETIDISKLPSGYGLENPTVKWYIDKKWLEVVGKGGGKVNAVQPVNINMAFNADNSSDSNDDGDNLDYDNDEFIGDNTDDDNGNTDNAPASSSLANKNVDRLTLDELKILAAEMTLEIVETDTRKTLIDKIKAAKNVNA